MNNKIVCLLGICAASTCLATTEAPFAIQCALLDQVYERANSETMERGLALEVLEHVAMGRMAGFGVETERQFGFSTGQFHNKDFKDATVRAYALEKIGNVNSAESLAFLQNLTRDNIGPDDTGRVWSSAKIALHQALVNRIPDERGKVEFLETTAKERNPASSWAVDQLCDRASYGSRSVIERSIRERNPGPDGEKDIRFCERRMAIIGRDPDSVRALGSYLRVSERSLDHDLINWAIHQLVRLNSAKADAELRRYMLEITVLPDGSLQKQELSQHGQAIKSLLVSHSK